MGIKHDLSVKEMLAVFVSREINDYEYVIPGAGMAVSRYGVLLAHLTRCPNLRISLSSYVANLFNEEISGTFQLYSEPGYLRYSEYCTTFHDHIEEGRHIDVTFVGAMQVDKYGNTNLIGIGEDYRHLRVRGPGSAGTTTFTAEVGRYYIIVNSHSRKVFVDKCDFRSTVGWDYGGREARRKMGLTGGGPKYVISPLCIMDFSEEEKHLRVKHLLPGVDLQEVLDNTGFKPIVDEIEPFPLPTRVEIEALRKKVDREGRLRTKEG
jgi:glutaconate CoA-transferase subunit B